MSRKKKGRVISLLLSCLMIVGLIPNISTASFAENTQYISMAYPMMLASSQVKLVKSGVTTTGASAYVTQTYMANAVGGLFTEQALPMGTNGFSLAAKTNFGSGQAANIYGNGMAFVFAKTATECSTNSGDGLGYSGLSGESVAVQYFSSGAPSARHGLALGIDGVQNDAVLDDEGLEFPTGWMPANQDVYFWIDYSASSTTLSVYMSFDSTRPETPTQTYTIDMSDYTTFHLGVTAGTGTAYRAHIVKSLYYDATYHSESLSMDGTVTYSDNFPVTVTADSAEISDTASVTGFEYIENGSVETPNAVMATAGYATITGLAENTTYDYRPYWVIDDSNTVYGEWKSFTTLARYRITVSEGCYIGTDETATSAVVSAGDTVTVTAPEIEGTAFSTWTDDEGNFLSRDAVYTFTASQDLSLTANYLTLGVLSGSGTRNDPYKITDESDLNTFAMFVNGGDASYAGASYVLTADIALTKPFTPIGFYEETDEPPYEIENAFKGVFDGNGHTISNLQVSDVMQGGLFGYATDATFKNLTLSDASIFGDEYAGTIVGNAGDVEILNCAAVHCDVESQTAGGIVGMISGSASLCSVMDTTVTGVQSSDSSGYNDVRCGGIVGAGYIIDVSLCTVENSTITTLDEYRGYAGGIVGKNNGYQPTGVISDCTVLGGRNTTVRGRLYVGGIAGYVSEDIENCTVNCDIFGAQTAGGIAGTTYYSKIANCEYNGTIAHIGTSGLRAGGILGLMQYTQGAAVQNCVAYGTIESDTSYMAGGILAEFSSSDKTFLIENNVAMQSEIVSGKVNSLCVDSDAVALETSNFTDNYTGDFLTLTGTAEGIAGTPKTAAEMDEAFWANLGFTPANGWVYETENKVTSAAVEVHRGDVEAFTLTVSGNAVPCYLDTELAKNGEGNYTVYSGMAISMRAAEGYKITQMEVNGTVTNETPWTFMISENTDVSVETEEAITAIWAYDGKYTIGAYAENSTPEDIDWTGAKTTPISGAYADMDLYLFDGDDPTVIGQLNLGSGNVMVLSDGYRGSIDIEGSDVDSFLIANHIMGDKAFEIYDLVVQVNAVDMTNELNVFKMGDGDAELTVKGDVQVSDFYALEQVTVEGNLDVSGDLEFYGGTLTVNGDVSADSIVLGSGYYEGGAILNVKGVLQSEQGMKIVTTKSALVNATTNSPVSIHFSNDTEDVYYRTTLTEMPKNVLMTFEAKDSGDTQDMMFTQRTDETGRLVVWMRKSGDAVTATTTLGEPIVYTGDVSVGSPEIAMKLPSGAADISMTANVPEEQFAGNTVQYSDIQAVSSDSGYSCDDSYITVSLSDDSGNTVALDAALSLGTYELLITYLEKGEADQLLAYGSAAYPITVFEDYQVTFEVAGGTAVENERVKSGASITLPTTKRSGYTFEGWSDGTDTYEAGSSYLVTQDVTLTALWKRIDDNSSNEHNSGAESGSGSTESPSAAETPEGFYSLSLENGKMIARLDTGKILEEARQGNPLIIDFGSAQQGTCILTGETFRALRERGLSLQLQSDGSRYDFSPNAIAIQSILEALDADESALDAVEFTVSMTELTDDEASFARNAAQRGGYSILSAPIEFNIMATYKGKHVEISRFNHRVERYIAIPDAVAPQMITTGIVISANGTQRHVPTTIVQMNGRNYARLSAFTNSTYVLVNHTAEFSDTAGKWYENIASEMASRMVMSGRGDGTFDGESNITRAEFAAILIHALGFEEDGSAAFNDVSTDAWYAGAVGTAVSYELVSGYTDGNFYPNKNLTRQEAMQMVYQAAVVLGYDGIVGSTDLSGFTDQNEVADWAEKATLFNVSGGLIVGSDNQLRPNDAITRAESAAVILKLLQKSGLIDTVF